jgi:hypothetical protein
VSIAGAIDAKKVNGEAAIDAKGGAISTLSLSLTTDDGSRP